MPLFSYLLNGDNIIISTSYVVLEIKLVNISKALGTMPEA